MVLKKKRGGEKVRGGRQRMLAISSDVKILANKPKEKKFYHPPAWDQGPKQTISDPFSPVIPKPARTWVLATTTRTVPCLKGDGANGWVPPQPNTNHQSSLKAGFWEGRSASTAFDGLEPAGQGKNNSLFVGTCLPAWEPQICTPGLSHHISKGLSLNIKYLKKIKIKERKIKKKCALNK